MIVLVRFCCMRLTCIWVATFLVEEVYPVDLIDQMPIGVIVKHLNDVVHPVSEATSGMSAKHHLHSQALKHAVIPLLAKIYPYYLNTECMLRQEQILRSPRS